MNNAKVRQSAAAEPEKMKVEINERDSVTALLYAAAKRERKRTTLILGHGAGANQLHPFMQLFAKGLAARGLRRPNVQLRLYGTGSPRS